MSSNMCSMRSVRGGQADARSSRDGGFQKGFYGTAPKNVSGGFSLLKKKKKMVPLEDDCRAQCKGLDQYKEAADKLHSALMFMLFESKSSVDALAKPQIPKELPMNTAYKYLSDYLAFFDNCQKQSNKGKYEKLEPVVAGTKKIYDEQEKYVRKQLETLKPFTKFIGEEYWEYLKLKASYQIALEKLETASKSKGSSEQEEKVLQKTKEDSKAKMMAVLLRITDSKEKHAKCILKFTKAATEWHKTSASILAPYEVKDDEKEQESKSAPMSSEKVANK